MLQLQPSRGAVQAPGPHHPVPGVGLRAAGGLGPGAPAAAGPRQQGVEAVVSAGVVPLVAVVDERSLVDEQGALGVVLPRLTWFRFLQVGGGENNIGQHDRVFVEKTGCWCDSNGINAPTRGHQGAESRGGNLIIERGKPIKGSVNTVDLQSISAKTPN